MNNNNFTLINHPLIVEKMALLRKKGTKNNIFRNVLAELSYLMAFEITRDLKLKNITIETPLETCETQVVSDDIVIVPILRAGLGMVPGISNLIPSAKVGHIGLFRDENSLEPKEYYCKLPANMPEKNVILLDPMLATGGSVSYAVDLLKKNGAVKIKFVCIVAAPEGLNLLQTKHPDVQIYSAALDRELNNNGYILPGLGDCGDRIFGTE